MKTQITSRFTLVKLLAVAAAGLAIQSAQASLLFSEAFNYTAPGALQSQVNPGNSATWTGGNNGLRITTGNLTYPLLQDQAGNELSLSNASGGSSYITYANQTSGQVYVSFLFNPSVVDGANDYVMALNPGTTTPGGSSDAINFYYYNNGLIYLRAAGGSATSGTGTALTIGNTYFIVEELDLTGHAANLWIDPTPGASAPTATASIASGLTATAVDNLGFKTQSTTGQYLIDNILIGTSWADVTPTAAPEPTTLALAGLGLVSLAAGYRRSRK
jgi:hypothetical protein